MKKVDQPTAITLPILAYALEVAKRFLEERGLYDKVDKYLQKSENQSFDRWFMVKYCSLSELFYGTPWQIIYYAFIWNDTEEGFAFWDYMNRELDCSFQMNKPLQNFAKIIREREKLTNGYFLKTSSYESPL